MFNSYLNRINLLTNGNKNITPNGLLDILTEEISKSRFTKSFEILLGVANYDNSKSKIFDIFSNGGFEEIKNHLEIGSGAQYSMLFLNRNWDPKLNMLQVSKIGYYIIRYIETLKLDDFVGLNNEYPSIWFIPDGSLPYKVTDSKLKDLRQLIEKNISP